MCSPKCGICGLSLMEGDLTSDPSQHICLELNGANIIKTEPGQSAYTAIAESSPEDVKATVLDSMAGQTHNSNGNGGDMVHGHNIEDLAEIGRMHMELKQAHLQDGATSPSPLPVKEVALNNGESLIVKVSAQTAEA